MEKFVSRPLRVVGVVAAAHSRKAAPRPVSGRRKQGVERLGSESSSRRSPSPPAPSWPRRVSRSVNNYFAICNVAVAQLVLTLRFAILLTWRFLSFYSFCDLLSCSGAAPAHSAICYFAVAQLLLTLRFAMLLWLSSCSLLRFAMLLWFSSCSLCHLQCCYEAG